MKIRRWRRLLKVVAALLLVAVAVTVWVTHQFPALVSSPKTSVEVLRDLFHFPVRMVADPAEYVFDRVNRTAMEVFVRGFDLEEDVEERLVAMVRGDRFHEVTVPFVYYIYELYGAPIASDSEWLEGLGYDEEPDAVPSAGAKIGVATLVAPSEEVRKQIAVLLRLFDALFLQPLAGGDAEAQATERTKTILRDVLGALVTKSDDALSQKEEENEYLAALETILEDDHRLTELTEFFRDFVRATSDDWLGSFVQREERKRVRAEWVDACLSGNRYHELADFARARASRRLVVQVAVDGLQGMLLEGLADLSGGRGDSAAARYVSELVRWHEAPALDPARYTPRMPAGTGSDLQELVHSTPLRPDYLKNFKKYVFGDSAAAVAVRVATVETPTISVRNLPILYFGHGVAGPWGTGIPNFSYLDRVTGRGWYFWGSNVLYMKKIFGNREDQIPRGRRRAGHGAKTHFERLWRYTTVSCMATVDTGALEKFSSEIALAIGELRRNFMEKIVLLRFRRRAEMERQLNERRVWLMERRNVSNSFLGSLLLNPVELTTFHEYARFLAEHEDEGLPDYTLWYFPWPDHFAHYEGPYSDEIIGYRGEYDRLDFYLGKFIELYESVPGREGQRSTVDRTLFAVGSDHGLVYTPRVVSMDEIVFDAMRRDGIQVSFLKITHDEGGLPAIHGRDNVKPTRPFDAVVGSTAGGSYVMDLFEAAGLAGDDRAWKRHPDYHALRQHRLLSGQTIDWIEELKSRLHDTMDLMLVREYVPAPGETWPAEVESVVRVITPDRGEARILRMRRSESEGAGRQRYDYELLGDQDPLELVQSVRDYLLPPDGRSVSDVQESLRRCIQGAAIDDNEWQSLLSCTLRPDCIHQLSHLYDSERAGTINVFPLRHVGMNSEVPGRHAGETFGEKNGTQIYFGAGIKRGSIQTARLGSMAVTLYHWLVGDDAFRAPDPETGIPPSGQFGFPTLLDDPAFRSIRWDGRE